MVALPRSLLYGEQRIGAAAAGEREARSRMVLKGGRNNSMCIC